MSVTEDPRERIRKLNRELGEKVNRIKIHLESAKSNGILGVDDPVSRAFEKRIQRLNIRATEYLSNNFDQPEVPEPDKAQSTLSTLWSYVWGMTGYGDRDATLEEEVADRVNICKNAQDLYNQLKATTKSAARYSQVSRNFAEDHKRLAMLDDGSAVLTLHRLKEMAPPNEVFALYMKRSFSNSIEVIESDILQPSFEAMEKEIKLIASVREVRQDKDFRVILDRALEMARVFVIMLNKYYEGTLGLGFAEFASDRFKAIYTLIQNCSSLLRTILKLQKPILDALHKVDLTPLSTVYCRQDPVRMANLFAQQKKLAQELHRQETLKIANEKIVQLVRLCQEFFVSTDNVTQAAFSVPIDPIMDAGMLQVVPRSDKNGLSRHDKDIESLYSRLSSLFGEDEDPHYVPTSRIAISQGESASMADVIAELKSRNLFELKDTGRQMTWHDEGSFGEVYKVPFAHADLMVAIKSYKAKNSEHKAYKQIVREATIMSTLDHENILHVYGYREVPSEARDSQTIDVSLVSAYYPNGNLKEYIRNAVPELDKAKILRDIACALEYLHNPKNKKCGTVIHGDLRAMNVLIGPDQRALLCDFGMAVTSDMDETWTTETNRTHDAWLAYEFFDGSKKNGKDKIPLTVKTDIYAFGCICYEVLFEASPYHDFDVRQISVHKYLKQSPTLDCFPKAYRLEHGYRQLMKRCWHPEPARRPSASQLVQYIGEFVSFLSPPRS